MEMAMSHRSLAVIRPASRAFWWPRLRLRFTPLNRGHSPWSFSMMLQVLSLEPSLTKSTRLFFEIFSDAVRDSSLARRRLAVSGSTASSL